MQCAGLEIQCPKWDMDGEFLSTLWENFFLVEIEMVRGKPALLLSVAILKSITF